MKLDVLKLPYTKQFKIEEDISFDPEVFVCHFPLVEVKNCHVSISVQRFEEFIYISMQIKANVTLKCSYTLKDFDTVIKGSDELHFSPTDEDDDECITYKGNTIDLDPYIFNLLSASVPLSPKAPGANAPSSGAGYRVISDKDFYKEREEVSDSRFDVLKDLDFDE